MDAVVKTLSAREAITANADKPNSQKPTRAEAEEAVRTLLRWIGEDVTREGLIDTPQRVVKSYEEIFSGYRENPIEVLDRVFEEVEGYSDIVLVRDIPFFSHCEHHMVPIIGKAHIGYYPAHGVVGLSKLARVVELFARRLQTQEALTVQIADAIDEALHPRGLAIMIEAEHMCMSMRGIKKSGATTITTLFRGAFENNASEQARFTMLLRG